MTPRAKLSHALNRSIPERSLLTPAQWCADNLHFNEAGNRGAFTTKGSEYAVDVLNDFGDATVSDEVLVWGSQTRKTGTLMGGAAWCVVNDPCGFLWAMPSLTLAQKFAQQRWCKLLKASPATESYIPTGAARHDFARLVQILGAATFNFVGSNSAANLSSNPCRRVIGDEVDKFQDGSDKEASALNLLEQRTKGQVNPQRWKTSTPTLDTGLIWQEYLKGNQCRYFVACPHCSKEIVFAWSREMTAMPKLGCESFVRWDDAARGSEGDWDLDRVAATAHAVCPHCAGQIRDEHKPAMVRAGKWKPTNLKAPAGFVSRHLPSLYSTMPETSFGALAVKFLQAKRSTLGLQGFINGDLAEPFVDQDRQARRTERIADRIELNGKEGPLLMTIDCQQTNPHFWYVIRHWYPGGCSAIAKGSCEDWDELDEIQKLHNVPHAGVVPDSGQGKEAAEIYRQCASRASEVDGVLVTWMPSKGFHKENMWRNRETGALTSVRTAEVDPYMGTADANKITIPLLEFMSEQFKDVLARLREGKTDFKWSVARDVADEEYWRHMDGEIKRYLLNKKTGRTKYEWVKRGKTWPNHLFDCEIIQLAAATFLGLLDEQEEEKK